MRIQFVRVPPVDNFGATPEKVFMCISEVSDKGNQAESAATLKSSLGVAAVFITDEVVHFEPAQPECDVEPLLPGRLWDAAVVDCPVEASSKEGHVCPTFWWCLRTGTSHTSTNITPHGPCLYVSCAREHCRCEHSDPFKPTDGGSDA